MVLNTVRDFVLQYLSEAKLMQLATSSDDQPWVCSVWFASDDDLNIFWFSSQTRRHSFEVTKNRRVAGAIVLPHQPTDLPRGLQFQGHAQVLTDKSEVEHARSLYSGRIFPEERIEEFLHHPERPHRFYRLQPTQFVLFDTANFPENPRQELDIQ